MIVVLIHPDEEISLVGWAALRESGRLDEHAKTLKIRQITVSSNQTNEHFAMPEYCVYHVKWHLSPAQDAPIRIVTHGFRPFHPATST